MPRKKTTSRPPKTTRKRPSTPSGPTRWWVLPVLLLTALAFFPALDNGFVNWDDDVNLLENPHLAAFDWFHLQAIFGSTVMGGYNPLSIFTFALEKHFFGLDPFVFHLNNLLLHLLGVFLVFQLMRQLGLSPLAAAFGALLFGLHPMRVESVAWVTERKDVLFGVFYFGALLTYLRSLRQASRRAYWQGWTLLLFVFALFSKIQAVALPLSLLVLDYWEKCPLDWRLLWEKLPYFVGSLLVGLLGIYLLSQADTLADNTQYGLGERLLVGAYSYLIYLLKFVYPYEMSPLYPYPASLDWPFYAAPLGVLALLYGFYLAYQRSSRATVFALAFFTSNVFFVLQILAAGQGYKADRFTYVPYFGLFFGLAYAFDYAQTRWKDYQIVLRGGMILYLLGLGLLTWQQCGVWKNGETLWTHVLRYYQNTALPFGNLGHYYRGEKEYDLALQNYDRAVALNTREGKTFSSRGKTYFDMGRSAAAIEDYTRAIALDASEAEFFINRGAAYGSLGQFNPALADFNEGLRLDPDFKNAYLNRFLLYTQTNQPQKALADIESYLRLDPTLADMWYEKAMALRRLNRAEAALAPFNRAIQIDPNRGLYWHELAKAQFALGQRAAARQSAQRAQQLGVRVERELL